MTFNRYYTKLARGEWETVLGVHETKKLADAQTEELNDRYQTDEYYTEKHDEEKFKRENRPHEEIIADFREWLAENPIIDTMTFVCYSCRESMTVQNKGLQRARGYAWISNHQGHNRDYFVDKNPRKVVD